ncbi:MAG: autotransporter-associated beta strand repeat-containing protein, partial [Planctomycetaceae bacterium]
MPPRNSSPGLSARLRFSRQVRPGSRKCSAEPLEPRLLLTLNVGLSSGNLLVQETSAGVDDLTISIDNAAEEYIFHDPASNLYTTINSATGNGSGTIRVPFSKVNGDLIQILTGESADKITVASNFAPGSSRSLVLNTGAGSDVVHWNSASTLASISVTSELTEVAAATVKSTSSQTWSTKITLLNAVELQGSGISLSDVQAGPYPLTVTDSGPVSISGHLTATNNAAILITGSHGITVAAGSQITTDQGSITLNAPLLQGNAGNVSGIRIEDAFVGTAGGSITLTAETTASASEKAAVHLQGAQLSTAGNGVIVIHGAAANNAGAWGLRMLNGAQRSSLITHNGPVSLTGVSGSSGSYVGTSLAGALIRSTGNGQITLSGEARSTSTGMLIDNGCDIEANGTGAVSLVGLGTTGPQATITFDGLNGIVASPWLEKGLRFESASAFDGGFPHDMVGSSAANGFVDVTSTDGRPFNVFSMDVSENNGSIKSRTIHFTGFLATGGTVQQSVTTNSTFGPEEIQLSGFTNLSKLRFTFDSTTWDDIKFSYVSDGHVAVGNASLRAASGNIQFTSDRIRLLGTLTADIGGSVNWPQELTGTGLLRKIGAGTLTMSGATSHAGGTQVEHGLLQITGSVVSPVTVKNQGRLSGSGTLHAALDVHSGGLLEPGGIPGILNTGVLTLQQGSTLSLELAGPLPGNSAGHHDQLSVRGAATLAGNLSLTLTGGYQPAVG